MPPARSAHRGRTRPPERSGARRRQRSVRVSVAVASMVGASVFVAVAVALPSLPAAVPTGLLAVALAWAALRMLWTEVLQSRRDHAAERARLAREYGVAAERAGAAHAVYRATVTERLAAAHMTLREQEHTILVAERQLVASERRAGLAESKLLESGRRLDRVQARVHDLETELSLREEQRPQLPQEESDGLATWEGPGDVQWTTGEDPAVTDLSDWSARVRRRA